MKISDLLKQWQKSPSEDLRALILAIDERQPLEVLRNLESLKTAEVADRLNAFRTKAKDPRVTRALEELVMGCKWSSDGSKPMWRAVFELITRTADPRFRAIKPEFKVRLTMREWLEKQFANSIEDFKTEFPPGKDDAKWKTELAALPKVKKATTPHDETALYANVYADPGNDAPRLVLADALTERGDPRGEFITLQCSGASDPKRERALLKEHGKKWLGSIASVVAVDVEWRRGFPYKGRALFKAQRDAEKFGSAPEWATFEELTWSEPGASSAKDRQHTLHASTAFRHLRRAINPFLPGFIGGDAVFPNLEELEVWVPSAESARELAGASARFPKLHTLAFRHSSPGWFDGVTPIAQVKTLRLDGVRDMDRWITVGEAMALETLQLGRQFTITRDAKGQLSVLTVRLDERVEKHGAWDQHVTPNCISEVHFDPPLGEPAEGRFRAKVGPINRAPRDPEAMPKLDRAPICWLDDHHVLGTHRGQLFVIDVSGPKPTLARTFECDQPTSIIRVCDDGATILTANASRIRSIDAKTGKTRFVVDHSYLSTTIFELSDDHTRVARGRGIVVDLKTQKTVPAPRGAKEDLRAPDDSFWVRWVRDAPHEVRRLTERNGTPLEGGESFYGFHVDGNALFGCRKKELVKWDLSTGKITARIKLEDEHTDIAPTTSNDERFLVVLDGRTMAIVAKLPELSLVARMPLSTIADAVAISNDGKRLLVSGAERLGVLAVK